MPLRLVDAEVFGVTADSVTVGFRVLDDAGRPADAAVRVLVDGEPLAVSEPPAGADTGDGTGALGTRVVRLGGLPADRELQLELEAPGAEPPAPDRDWPGRVRTLPAPRARCTARFATLNDLHFGEPRFGGRLTADFESGDEAPGFPVIRAADTEVPYWRAMNEDAIAEINAAGVDAAFVKGDIADVGLPEQFGFARETFARFAMPHHAFLGNHDYYGRHHGAGEVDGYALLGQPPAPRTVDLGGWRLVLLETAEPGLHHGVFTGDRLAWLADTLAETRALGVPTLLLMHHQPVPPEHRDRYPNSIGIDPAHSLELFALVGANPQVRGVLIGHTHRNRVRRYPASGPVPFVEVNCTKDYPGGWARYELYEDGSFRQEVRRTATARALAHSTRCRAAFRGQYRDFALGTLGERSFVVDGG
jgi:3',5'-cyclic AMP phosphodiesterase CpdA